MPLWKESSKSYKCTIGMGRKFYPWSSMIANSAKFCNNLSFDNRTLFTRASVGKPESYNASRSSSPKGGHGPRRSLRKPRKLGTRMRWECVIILSLLVNNVFQHILLNAVFCEDRLAKIPVLYAHLTHKMISSVFGMGRSTNSIAWKLAECAKFILVITR